MSLTRTQTMVTVRVHHRKFAEIPEKLSRELEPYPNARIVTATQSIDRNFEVFVLAVVEYTPGGQDE